MSARRALLLAALAGCALVPALAAARQPPARFFFAGDGRLRLHSAHFGTTLDVRYRRADGSYDPAALARLQHFFRSREDGREEPIALRLIELLAYVQGRYRPRDMVLLSGYRSPQFNADLRAAGAQAAQASLHTQGLAADVAFSGIDLARLWRQLRALHTGGVGFYPSSHFLHIDTGPPRFWDERTSRVAENLSAGNARIFARTDFDRYPRLAGAVCSLHSITAFPLRLAPDAEVVAGTRTAHVRLEPLRGLTADADGCLTAGAPADAYALRVGAATVDLHGTGRIHLVLHTCAPRLEQTPRDILTNPLEVIGGARPQR